MIRATPGQSVLQWLVSSGSMHVTLIVHARGFVSRRFSAAESSGNSIVMLCQQKQQRHFFLCLHSPRHADNYFFLLFLIPQRFFSDSFFFRRFLTLRSNYRGCRSLSPYGRVLPEWHRACRNSPALFAKLPAAPHQLSEHFINLRPRMPSSPLGQPLSSSGRTRRQRAI